MLREGLEAADDALRNGFDVDAVAPKTALREFRPGPSAIPETTVFIKKITVTGATALTEHELRTIVQRYEGQPLGKTDLQNLANALTRAYRDNGFFLAKALIQPQTFANAELFVTISEGFVSRIEIDGTAKHPLIRYFDKTLQEQPAEYETFTRTLRLVRTNTGRPLQSNSVESDPDRNDGYVVTLSTAQSRMQGRIDIINKGVREGEAWRALLSSKLHSIIRAGDTITLGYLTKPALSSELQYYIGRYEVPVGNKGVVVFTEVTASDTKPKSVLTTRDLDGKLRAATLGLSYPVMLTTRQRFITTAKLEWSDSNEFENAAALYKDRLRLIRVNGVYRQNLNDSDVVRGFVEITQGFDTLNASDQPGVLTSRPDADGKFMKLMGEATVQKYLSDRVSITASVKGQYADNSLLYLEEFSLGGGAYGRGYDFGEILGDSGVAGYVEAGYHGDDFRSIDRWQLYAFADGGAVWNRGINISSDGDPLYSAGLGVRLYVDDNLFVGYEVAHPLSDAPFTLNDKRTRHRVQLTVMSK